MSDTKTTKVKITATNANRFKRDGVCHASMACLNCGEPGVNVNFQEGSGFVVRCIDSGNEKRNGCGIIYIQAASVISKEGAAFLRTTRKSAEKQKAHYKGLAIADGAKNLG